MPLFYALAALLLVQSLLSLRGGLRYLAHFRRAARATPTATYAPFATVFVPCRGLDQNLAANLAALFAQDYGPYEIVFVSDSAADPALAVAGELSARLAGPPVSNESSVSNGSPLSDASHATARADELENKPSSDELENTFPSSVRRVRALVAGAARDEGQKVHNLRAAVGEASAHSEVFVFVDTDARPARGWLRALVAPLADASVGAATGYRWFVPARGRLGSHLRSVWNASIASALGANARRNFCWGGSTAIRRETFERLRVRDRWRGALSDDFALTRLLGEAKLPIKFVPACLTATHEDCGLAELFEFTTRQLKITRVYAPRLWRIVLVSNLLFTLVFFSGVALACARLLAGQNFAAPLAFVLALYALGSGKAALRLRAVAPVLAKASARLRPRDWLAHLLLWPASSALFAWNALAAARSRRINWRGIAYELKSPSETRVLGRRDA